MRYRDAMIKALRAQPRRGSVSGYWERQASNDRVFDAVSQTNDPGFDPTQAYPDQTWQKLTTER